MNCQERAEVTAKDIARTLSTEGTRERPLDVIAGFVQKALEDHTDQVYLERAKLLAMVTRFAAWFQVPCGFGEHSLEDASWDPAWRTIVYVDLPSGQISFHIHERDRALFKHLKPYAGAWDGHSTDTKWCRVVDFIDYAVLSIELTSPRLSVQMDGAVAARAEVKENPL